MRSDRAGTENAGTRPDLVSAAEGSFRRGLSGSWQGSAPALLMVALPLHSATGGVITPPPIGPRTRRKERSPGSAWCATHAFTAPAGAQRGRARPGPSSVTDRRWPAGLEKDLVLGRVTPSQT